MASEEVTLIRRVLERAHEEAQRSNRQVAATEAEWALRDLARLEFEAENIENAKRQEFFKGLNQGRLEASSGDWQGD